MKKYLAILLGAVFVLCFAASAFAIHAEIPAESQAVVTKGVQVYVGGDIRIRGEFRQNTSDFNDDIGDHRANYDERVRLSVEAQVTPNTKAMIMIQGANGQDAATAWTWGDSSAGAKGTYGKGDTVRGTVNLLEAWILHTGSGLLGMPAGVKVGHMPLALGNKIFFDHTQFGDDALVFFADPTKELHVGLLTVKFQEGSVTKNDDSNAYVALFNYRTKEWGLSGDATYVNDQAIGNDGTDLWNFGLRGDVSFSGFKIWADGELQTGKAKGAVFIPLNDNHDLKFKGWAVDAGVSYTISGINLLAEYIYGSGNKGNDPNDFKQFVTALSNAQHYTYVYDYLTISAGKSLTAAGGASADQGAANTQYVRLGISGGLMKDLSGELYYYNLRANQLLAVEEAKGASRSIGNEFDAKITYKIDKNLNYWVEGGYLFAGNFWRTITPVGKDPDDAYSIRHGIQLTF